jgi:hypothetical protein
VREKEKEREREITTIRTILVFNEGEHKHNHNNIIYTTMAIEKRVNLSKERDLQKEVFQTSFQTKYNQHSTHPILYCNRDCRR